MAGIATGQIDTAPDTLVAFGACIVIPAVLAVVFSALAARASKQRAAGLVAQVDSTSAAGDDDSATPFDADSSASREVAVATIGRTVEHARERKTLPDFREMVDLLTEIERLTNYSTVVAIALSAAAEFRGAYVGELRDAYMKMWWQWHNHKDEAKYRADRLIIIAAQDGAHVSPDSEIGWMLLSVIGVWVMEGAPDRAQDLTEHFGPAPTLDEVNHYQGFGPKQPREASAPHVRRLIEALNISGFEGADALNELKGLGDAVADDLIHALRADPDPAIRCNVPQAMQELPPERVVPALIDALSDPEAGVRGAAATVLGNLGDARAVAALRDALERETDDYGRMLQEEALKVLTRTEGAESAAPKAATTKSAQEAVALAFERLQQMSTLPSEDEVREAYDNILDSWGPSELYEGTEDRIRSVLATMIEERPGRPDFGYFSIDERGNGSVRIDAMMVYGNGEVKSFIPAVVWRAPYRYFAFGMS